MPILLPEPVVINQEIKTYDGVWISSFVANFPSLVDGYLRIETKPFSTKTGEILNIEPTVISSDKLWELLAAVPEAALAMEKVISAIPLIQSWLDNQNAQAQDASIEESSLES